MLTPFPCPVWGHCTANPDPEGTGLLCSWVLCLSLHPCVVPAVTHVLLAARQYSQFPGVNPLLVTHTNGVTTNSSGVICFHEIRSAGLWEQRWRRSNGGIFGGWKSGGWGAGGQPTAVPPWGLWAMLSPPVPRMRGSSCVPCMEDEEEFLPRQSGGVLVERSWDSCPGGCGGSLPLGCSRTTDVALRTAGSTAGDGFGLDLVVLEIFSNLNGSVLPGVRKQQGSFPHRQTLGTASKLK